MHEPTPPSPAPDRDPPPPNGPRARRILKVAHLDNTYQGLYTGLGVKLETLQGFDDLDVVVIAPPGTPKPGEELPVPHFPVPIARTIRPLQDLRSIWRIYRICRRERFDIVHGHTAKAGVAGTIAAWLAGVPIIYQTYHGLPFYEGQSPLLNAFYRGLEWCACRLRRHVFSQNRRDLAECVKLMGDPRRVHFEGNGVHPERVRRQAQEHRAAGEAYFKSPGLRLLTASRLEAVKRPLDLVECVARLRDRGLQVCCVMAGSGPLHDAVQNRIAELELSDRIHLPGFVQHSHALIAACDIYMLTSEKEGIPRSVMEAMALAKPVVATDVLGTQEVVANGESGFLVPLGDVNALADRVAALAGDPDLRQRMGRAGAGRVETEFNDLRVARFLHDFYVRDFETLEQP